MTPSNNIGDPGALVEMTLTCQARTREGETVTGFMDRVRESKWLHMQGVNGRTTLSAPLEGEVIEFRVLEEATKEAAADG